MTIRNTPTHNTSANSGALESEIITMNQPYATEPTLELII